MILPLTALCKSLEGRDISEADLCFLTHLKHGRLLHLIDFWEVVQNDARQRLEPIRSTLALALYHSHSYQMGSLINYFNMQTHGPISRPAWTYDNAAACRETSAPNGHLPCHMQRRTLF